MLEVSAAIFNNVVDDSRAKPRTNARAGVKVKRNITRRMRTAIKVKVIAGAILGASMVATNLNKCIINSECKVRAMSRA